DLLGQTVVIYVKGLDYLSPNAAGMMVIGDVIIADDNAIVETTGRLKNEDKVKDAVKKGGLSMPSANSTLKVESVKINEKDDFTTTNGVEDMPGVHQRFIDNDADGIVDVIIAKNPALSKVNTYNEKDSKLNLSGIGSVDFEDILNADEVDAGDYVLVYNYDGTYVLEQAESVSGTVSAYVNNADDVRLSKITMDGVNYGAGSGKNLAADLLDPKGEDFKDLVDGVYTLYLDPHGNILGYVEDEGVVGNYAVITGVNPTSSNKGFYAVEVKLVLADGTTGKYDVNLLSSAKKWSSTTANQSTNALKEEAMFNALTAQKSKDAAAEYTAVGELVAYSIDNGTVTLSKLYGSRSYHEANTTAKLTLKSTTSSYTFNGEKVMADNKTAFFIKDVDGNYSAVAGLSKLPSSGLNTEEDTTSKVIYYTPVSGTSNLAKAIFVEVEEKYTSNASYAFITGDYTKSTVGGDTIYTYPVVLEDGTVSTLASKTDDGLESNTVYEYHMNGSYAEFDITDTDEDNVVNGKLVTKMGSNAISVADADNDALGKDSFAINNAKVYDVQDSSEAVETKLQQDQKVALVLNNEGDVKVAFVYGTIDDEFVKDVPVKIDGSSLTSGAVTEVAAGAKELKFSIPFGVTATVFVNGTKQQEFKNTVAGEDGKKESMDCACTVTVPAAGSVAVNIKLSGDGMASRTLKFTLKAQSNDPGPGPIEPDPIAPGGDIDENADIIKSEDATAEKITEGFNKPGNTKKEVVIEGALKDVVVSVPAEGRLIVKGDYTPTAGEDNKGTIEVTGTYNAPASVSGEVIAKDMAVTEATTIAGGAGVTITGDLKGEDKDIVVESGAELTVKGETNCNLTVAEGGSATVGGATIGTLTLKAPDASPAMLRAATEAASLTVNGKLTVETIAAATGAQIIFGKDGSVTGKAAEKFVDSKNVAVVEFGGKTFVSNGTNMVLQDGGTTEPSAPEALTVEKKDDTADNKVFTFTSKNVESAETVHVYETEEAEASSANITATLENSVLTITFSTALEEDAKVYVSYVNAEGKESTRAEVTCTYVAPAKAKLEILFVNNKDSWAAAIAAGAPADWMGENGANPSEAQLKELNDEPWAVFVLTLPKGATEQTVDASTIKLTIGDGTAKDKVYTGTWTAKEDKIVFSAHLWHGEPCQNADHKDFYVEDANRPSANEEVTYKVELIYNGETLNTSGTYTWTAVSTAQSN
ncbi:hypothetical protein D1159_15450, partial [Pseudoflavonifractor sp. 524-17]|uniref:hypothetical protein n=1 Tax=Pseudoflavonifractor sp. 524-17 TaxID=2304577 RepID=UPI00137A10DC